MPLVVHFGLGTDIWTLGDNQIIVVVIVRRLNLSQSSVICSHCLVQLFYVAEFAYIVETSVTKLSILLLYLRIFPARGLRKQIHFIMVILLLIFIAFIIGLFNYCKPFRYTWVRWDNQEEGKCENISAQTFIHAGLNIILDLVIIFIPVPHM